MSDRPIDVVLSKVPDARGVAAGRWECRCTAPEHADKRASLSIAMGADGRVLVHCHAGCTLDAVLAGMGLKSRDLFPANGHAPEPAKTIEKTYDYRDADGTLLFQVVRFRPKTFRQRRPDGNGGWIWKMGDTVRVLYRLPELLSAPSGPRLIVEGEKDADNLWKLGFPATCNPGGAGKWSKLRDHAALDGHKVFIIADKDGPGRAHAAEVAAATGGTVLELPGPGKDASDWISAGGTADQLRAILADAERTQATPAGARPEDHGGPAPELSAVQDGSDGEPSMHIADEYAEPRPVLQLTADEHLVIPAAIQAIAGDRSIYQRARRLVRVVRDRAPKDKVRRASGSPVIEDLPAAILSERLAAAMLVQKFDGRAHKWVHAHPPAWLVDGIIARADWPTVRVLAGTSEIPVLRSDGSVFDTPGYDAETGIGYDPGSCRVKVATPSQDEAATMSDELCRAVADHPFEEDSHRAAWLAGLLTIVARPAFEGPAPLFLVDANVRGAGKGLLVQAAANVAFGRNCPVATYTHEGPEFEKVITSIIQAGDVMVLLDNVEGKLGNAALDRLLTSTSWHGRVLGQSAMIDMPCNAVWWATSNNAQIGADTARRCLHVRLDSPDESPEDREGFQHPDLIPWIRQERPRLLAAAMGIMAGFFRAGCPQSAGTKPYGSFEGWSKIVRHAVIWCGHRDPCDTRAKLAAMADTQSAGAHRLIDALWAYLQPSGAGITAEELARELWGSDPAMFRDEEARAEMKASIEAIITYGKMSPTGAKIGYRFRAIRRRVFGKRMIDADGENRNGQLKWVVREI